MELAAGVKGNNNKESKNTIILLPEREITNDGDIVGIYEECNAYPLCLLSNIAIILQLLSKWKECNRPNNEIRNLEVVTVCGVGYGKY